MDPTIVAIGGGGGGSEPEDRALDDYLLGLTGKELPRVLFVPTASGDHDTYIARFYGAFSSDRCRPMHLPLFQRSTRDLRGLVLRQDVVYVGGGNTAALLAIWRQHGLHEILREAWQSGVLLSGVSAGANCWFEACSTDSFGPELDPLEDGLGFLPGSFCPHYDGEARRRPSLRAFISEGRLPGGWAADDHAALRFTGTECTEAFATKLAARAYRVSVGAGGEFEETTMSTRLLQV